MAIGLSIVAFGTSAPELIINVASIQGKTEITFGNVIGSNIVKILLILGIAGIMGGDFVFRIVFGLCRNFIDKRLG
jgi:cation:H+ antiporter